MAEPLPHKELFFIPFSKEELVWLSCSPDRPEDCLKDVALSLEQSTRQDYRMVILTDLCLFPNSQYEHIRPKLMQLLRVFWNENLLRQMDEQGIQMPTQLIHFFLYSGVRPEHIGVAEHRVLQSIFGMTPENFPPESLDLIGEKKGLRFCLPFTDIFSTELADSRQIFSDALERPEPDEWTAEHTLMLGDPEPAQHLGQEEPDLSQSSLDRLEQKLREALKSRSVFSYELGGDRGIQELEIQESPFPVNDGQRELVLADLQLGLSHLLMQGGETILTAHTSRELEALLRSEAARFDHIFKNRPPQSYYELKALPSAGSANIEADIRSALRDQAADLPCVREAVAEDPDPEPGDTRLETAWLRVFRSLRRFRELFGQFMQEYDKELVREEQTRILDICADTFRDWRVREALRPDPPLPKVSEKVRPQLDLKERIKALSQEQERLLAESVEQLEDYEDKREEAAEIVAAFESEISFENRRNEEKAIARFQRFSLICGGLFVVSMLLPYLLIEWGQLDARLPQYFWALISLGAFAVIYCIGLLIWLRGLSKKLKSLSRDLAGVIQESRKRRIGSVKKAVEIYGELLPDCVRKKRELRFLEHLDRLNESKERNYSFHNQVLKDAGRAFGELRSSLRLVDRDSSETVRTALPDYDLPPWEGKNRALYLLRMSGEEGSAE